MWPNYFLLSNSVEVPRIIDHHRSRKSDDEQQTGTRNRPGFNLFHQHEFNMHRSIKQVCGEGDRWPF